MSFKDVSSIFKSVINFLKITKHWKNVAPILSWAVHISVCLSAAAHDFNINNSTLARYVHKILDADVNGLVDVTRIYVEYVNDKEVFSAGKRMTL